VPISDAADPRLAGFDAALHDLMRDLAIQVAKDGEGVSKFVTIEVSGAENWEAARKIGLSLGNSPLLKTALSAGDPNWGRVVMAVGKTGEAADRDRMSIYFGDQIIARNGERAVEYKEDEVAAYMALAMARRPCGPVI
jgi:glutamate N-acetyltransferase / amino-acid N-acetyltransferase